MMMARPTKLFSFLTVELYTVLLYTYLCLYCSFDIYVLQNVYQTYIAYTHFFIFFVVQHFLQLTQYWINGYTIYGYVEGKTNLIYVFCKLQSINANGEHATNTYNIIKILISNNIIITKYIHISDIA